MEVVFHPKRGVRGYAHTKVSRCLVQWPAELELWEGVGKSGEKG